MTIFFRGIFPPILVPSKNTAPCLKLHFLLLTVYTRMINHHTELPTDRSIIRCYPYVAVFFIVNYNLVLPLNFKDDNNIIPYPVNTFLYIKNWFIHIYLSQRNQTPEDAGRRRSTQGGQGGGTGETEGPAAGELPRG